MRSASVLAVCTLVIAIAFVALNDADQTALADAQGQAVVTGSTSVTCPPFNLFNPDAGSGVNGMVDCSPAQPGATARLGYKTFRMESETASPYYVCGITGCTKTNYATVGLKRCSTCTFGGAFTADFNQRLTRCISGTADAGVTAAVLCGN